MGYDWEECSRSCSTGATCGVRVRIASGCVPEYAVCQNIQIEREDCGCEKCTESLTNIPVGTIMPWTYKPNQHASGTSDYKDYDGWIKCDGQEECKDGIFKGQKCQDLSDRALIGATTQYKALGIYDATFPEHHHPHTHFTKEHSHTEQTRNREGHCGMGGSSCGQSEKNQVTSTTKVEVIEQKELGVK